MEIVSVESAEQLAQVRELFEEYWSSFEFTPCFQDFGAELASLPGSYAPPAGRLGLAMVDGEPAGCGALKRFDATRCEAKRLYVRPAYRGMGIGLRMLKWVIGEARAIGYLELLGDTMPVMEKALVMYEHEGFERTGPYAANPTAGAIFIRLKL